MLPFAVGFALMQARKLVCGLRQGLTEEERVADDVVRRLQDHGDPWLPPATGKGYSTTPLDSPELFKEGPIS
jgi:hypothetical protein